MRTLLVLISLVFAGQSAAGRLTYTAPATWHSRTPSSSMRIAEFVIPRAAGDTEDAQLVLYYFGPQGSGSAQANIDRWIGQMQRPDGSPAKADAQTNTRTINGLRVSSVDVSGTYAAEMSPGAAEHFDKPGFRLRAAVIDTPRGRYYVKLTGPAKTVAAAGHAVDRFLASLKYSPSPSK
jgi:hypothetical protein